MKNVNVNWQRRGLCSDLSVDPDMWFATDTLTRRLAQHLCLEHCPVLAECTEETKRFPYRGVVIAGMILSDRDDVPVKETTPKGARVYCYVCEKHPDWDWKPQ